MRTKHRTILALVAGLGLILPVTAAAVPRSSSPSPAASSGSSTSSVKIPPAASPAPPPRPDKIELVATSPGLADAYGGDVVHPAGPGDGIDGTVTVYVTSAGRARMASALSKAVGPPSVGGYDLKEVAHSFASLEALTMRLFADEKSLKNNGIDMVSWGPDIASNTVMVKIANYTSSAAQSLERQYGGTSWLTVAPAQKHLPTRTANRYYDSPYFYNGDRVLFNNNFSGTKCTAAFAYTGNNSGNIFSTTAGHCGGSSVWTNYNNHYKMGNISTNYFSSSSGWDMESFHCECAYPIWYEGPSIGTSQGYLHNVAGTCYCGVGSYVTMDGATTGEVGDNKVVQVNFCYKFNDGITTCHLNYAYNPNGYTICQGGDSGSPAYQRSSTSNVYATGLIVGTDFGDDCYYHLIGAVMSKVNGTLITG